MSASSAAPLVAARVIALVRRQVTYYPRGDPWLHVGADGCLRFPLLPLPAARFNIQGAAGPSARVAFLPFRCTVGAGDTSQQVLQ